MASDTIKQRFLAEEDVLNVTETDIDIERFKNPKKKELRAVTIPINDAERFSQFSQFFHPTRQELCESHVIKPTGKQVNDEVWAFRVSIEGNKNAEYIIQFQRNTQIVSYSTIYNTDVLIAHYKAACDWIRTTSEVEFVSTLLASLMSLLSRSLSFRSWDRARTAYLRKWGILS